MWLVTDTVSIIWCNFESVKACNCKIAKSVSVRFSFYSCARTVNVNLLWSCFFKKLLQLKTFKKRATNDVHFSENRRTTVLEQPTCNVNKASNKTWIRRCPWNKLVLFSGFSSLSAFSFVCSAKWSKWVGCPWDGELDPVDSLHINSLIRLNPHGQCILIWAVLRFTMVLDRNILENVVSKTKSINFFFWNNHSLNIEKYSEPKGVHWMRLD